MFFIDIIYPPTCIICEDLCAYPNVLCGVCWSKLFFITGEHCVKCFSFTSICSDNYCINYSHHYDEVKSILRYDEHSKDLIYKLKYYARFEVKKLFASWIAAFVYDFKEVDLILSVPLHKKKFKKRGFNQSEILAKILSNKLRCPYHNKILLKTRNSIDQNALNKVDRIKNVANSFMVNVKEFNLKGKVVLLVDDVVTTGATVNECAKVLKKFGAKSVLVFSLARR